MLKRLEKPIGQKKIEKSTDIDDSSIFDMKATAPMRSIHRNVERPAELQTKSPIDRDEQKAMVDRGHFQFSSAMSQLAKERAEKDRQRREKAEKERAEYKRIERATGQCS